MAKWRLLSRHQSTLGGFYRTTVPSIVSGGICTGLGLFLFLAALAKQEESGTLVLGLGFLALLPGLVLSGYVLKKYLGRARWVRIYAEGLAWEQGGEKEERSWEDVAEVYRKEEYVLVNGAAPNDENRDSELRILFEDGTVARFNHALRDYDDLAAAVQKETTGRLTQRLHTELKDTGESEFGPVILRQDGLVLKENFYPWKKLKRVTTDNGHLCCRTREKTSIDIPLKEVPNYPVFLTLLAEMERLNPRQEHPHAEGD